ncbi:MAG: alpha-glucosidase [Bacteroidia bacterium]|nr:alpha-glucosidase [Bacteroidia bacterium]
MFLWAILQGLVIRASSDTLLIRVEDVEVAFRKKDWLSASLIRPIVSSKMGSYPFSTKYGPWYRALVDTYFVWADTAGEIRGQWEGIRKTWRIELRVRNGVLWWRWLSDSLDGVAVRLRWLRHRGEESYGLGVQSVPGALDGRRYRLWTEEQGIGRGKQPLSFLINLVVRGAAGTLTTSYAPMGTFITRYRRGAALFHQGVAFWESRSRFYQWEFWLLNPQAVEGAFWGGRDWGELLHRQSQLVGPMPLLPAWCKGAWVGLQGGWGRVLPILTQLKRAGVPLATLWIQDWCGRRATRFGSQLWWRWIPDTSAYPDIRRRIDSLRREGIRTLGYVNPFLATEGPLFDTARTRAYLVSRSKEQIYFISTPGFPAVMVDLTHPEAYAWLRGLVRRLREEYGFSGWMADYGEWLPWDAWVAAGQGSEWHNRYAVLWARLNREAAEEDEIVFFTRCGHTFTPRYTRLHWLGDQLVSWDARDGLQSTFYGMLHSGLSGLPLMHSDIGGYTTIKVGPLRYLRSRQLLLRWAESCVIQPVFRTHEGLRPQDNHQVYTDSVTVAAFAYLAQLHVKLWAYLQSCAQGYGLTDTLLPYAWAPIWRPLWMHASKTPKVKHPSFFIGPDLLFYPVTRPRQRWIRAYLPPGTWYALTADTLLAGGQFVKVPAPLGKPCLFLRKDSSPYQTLRAPR